MSVFSRLRTWWTRPTPPTCTTCRHYLPGLQWPDSDSTLPSFCTLHDRDTLGRYTCGQHTPITRRTP